MADLQTLRTEVRRRIGEASSAFFTDAEITSLLNEAQRDFASEEGVIEGDRGFALVANQYEYTPPADFINTRYLLFEEDTKLRYLSQRELFNVLRADPNQTGDPIYWAIWEKKIRVFPTPSAAADSTQLDGAINNTVTTITVDSTTGFPTSGRIKINSEEIHYYNTSATQFLQCVRGQAGTSAASHSDNDTVDELNLRLFYYKDPTAMSADTDTPDIPTEYHDALVYYASGMLKIKDQLFDQGQFHLVYFANKKRQARAEIKKRQRDRNPRILPGDRGYRTSQGQP